jgi:hypothetical protein
MPARPIILIAFIATPLVNMKYLRFGLFCLFSPPRPPSPERYNNHRALTFCLSRSVNRERPFTHRKLPKTGSTFDGPIFIPGRWFL